MKFGSIKPKVLTHILFWTGLVAIVVSSFFLGISLSATTEWHDAARAISDTLIKPYSQIEYNILKAIAIGCGATLIFGIIWRVICEFCYLKLVFLHNNLNDDTIIN